MRCGAITTVRIRPEVGQRIDGHVSDVARTNWSDCTSETRDSDSTKTSESIWPKLGIGIDGNRPKVDTKFDADCANEERDIAATKSKERRAHHLLKSDKLGLVAMPEHSKHLY